MFHQPSLRGFTLVETLVATGVLITAIAGLAQLFTLSVRVTRDSAQFGTALLAAQDKLESLRSFHFTYDDDGNLLSDGRWTHDADKFYDGVFRIQCLGCRTMASWLWTS